MAVDAERLILAAMPPPPQRRALLFQETFPQQMERWALGAAWALRPQRIGALPTLARIWLSDLISRPEGLPDPRSAPAVHEGVCGIVHDLSVPTLVRAYERGLYTFAHFGPLKWFCPPERCVLFFDEAHVGKNLKRLLRQGRYRVTFDQDFEAVIKACAGRRDGKWHVTWITPRIMHAYADLYDAGYVHSFEVWNSGGALVGGGYGVALGNVFFTKSQFSLERDTSKLGFTVLNWHLEKWGFLLNDAKASTPTVVSMGFRNISRAEFLAQLANGAAGTGKPGRWQVEVELATVAGGKPQSSQRAREAQSA